MPKVPQSGHYHHAEPARGRDQMILCSLMIQSNPPVMPRRLRLGHRIQIEISLALLTLVPGFSSQERIADTKF